MLAADVLPVIPSQGSVGASGDLAPLAHLALALIGEGRVAGRAGARRPAARALHGRRARAASCSARRRASRSSTACRCPSPSGGSRSHRALELARVADLAGAVSLDASRGSDAAFDPRIIAARPHPGAAARRGTCASLLAGSAIRESHRGCGRVQDNYALRCMPQVHGAARDAFDHARARRSSAR